MPNGYTYTSTYPVTAHLILRDVTVEELTCLFDDFHNNSTAKEIRRSMQELYDAVGILEKEFAIVPKLQQELYMRLQTILANSAQESRTKTDLLLSECISLALYKLSHLYPALNQYDTYQIPTSSLHATEYLKLSSGHHESLQNMWRLFCKIPQNKLTHMLPDQDKGKRRNPHYTVNYIPVLNNPHTHQPLSSRDLINLLYQAQKKGLWVPSQLIRIDQDGDPVFIGNEKARKKNHACPWPILPLEDIQFYYMKLSVDASEIPTDLVRLAKEKQELKRAAKSRIEQIRPYIDHNLIKKHEANQLSKPVGEMLVKHQQRLSRIAETNILQLLIPEQRQTIDSKRTLNHSDICKLLYAIVCQGGTDSAFELNSEELLQLINASQHCVKWLDKHTPSDRHLSLGHIQDFLHSREYQAFNTQLCMTALHHHRFLKGQYRNPTPENKKSIFFGCVENKQFHSLLRKTRKRLHHIHINPDDIDGSIGILLENAQTDGVPWAVFINNNILPFSALTYFTEQHRILLRDLIDGIRELPYKTQQFLERNKCNNDEQFLKYFFGDSSAQGIANKLQYLDPLKNIQSKAVQCRITTQGLSLTAALGLTHTERLNIEKKRDNDNNQGAQRDTYTSHRRYVSTESETSETEYSRPSSESSRTSITIEERQPKQQCQTFEYREPRRSYQHGDRPDSHRPYPSNVFFKASHARKKGNTIREEQYYVRETRQYFSTRSY